ncbi:MAG TPA: SpoIIE family protein phosphatase [Bacillales bacterium]|nr:SpoIIE family protein phosphatase [Bacillales bacterium]
MIENYRFDKMRVSAFQLAKQGETQCGDSYYMMETNDYFLCMLADGLGSGPDAKKASQKAVSIVRENPDDDVETLVEKCNCGLRNERGAVLSVFKIDFHKGLLEFSGVGNIRFVFYPPNEKAVYPIPKIGFLSGKRFSARVQTFSFPKHSSFVIYSDGLGSVGAKYPSSCMNVTDVERISECVAAYVMDDARSSDDVTFIVGKNVSE